LQNGSEIARLAGHADFSFSNCWHPTIENICVTASQDCTARVWDLRSPRASLFCLGGVMAPIRSACYSHDGRFLTLAEAADFVHVLSHDDDYQRRQTIDFYSEISGCSWAADDSRLFIAACDRAYGCIFEFASSSLREIDDIIF
jgi:WD40 repeat protein